MATVRLLSRHLTNENHAELIAAASGKSKRQVEELVACRFPQPDVAAAIRRLPAPAAAGTPAATPIPGAVMAIERPAGTAVVPIGLTASTAAAETTVPAPAPLSVPPIPVPTTTHRPVVTPLSADRYKVTFTASAETCARLRRVQDLMRHAVPDGDTAIIFDRALVLLLDHLERRKFGAMPRPRPRSAVATPCDSRRIPADVRRIVWKRDDGRCTFVGEGDRRSSRAFLEFHHVRPFAEGGEATVQNIRLLCGSHNRHEAEVFSSTAIRSAADVGIAGFGAART